MKLIENINDYCSDNDITIKALAKKIGIGDSALYKYVNGKSLPTVDVVVKIANYMDCSINFLVGLDNDPKLFKFKQTYDRTLFFPRYDALLKQNKITHYQLAKKLNFAQANLDYWKKGILPYLDKIYDIANYFGVSIDYLIGRADEV